jgi:hypothetical protein
MLRNTKEMPKEPRSREEIETLIRDRCYERHLHVRRVTVLPSEHYGWVASFAADPKFVMLYTSRFEDIVDGLRETFDLAEE